ncbi:MAG: PAS domain S-box protein, partial [Phycisphaerae bacterium]
MKAFPVVVADDDAATLTMLETLLGRAGFQVFPCADGQEALTLVKRHKPVILLADWKMPKIAGPELCRKIRDSALGDEVYAILITGNSQPEEIAAGLDMGANDYMVKPIQTTILLARVRAGERVLQIRMRQRENARNLESEIAKRKVAEEALRESEAKFKSICGSAQDAIIMMDADGNISYWNEAAEAMFGYTQEEVIGRFLHSVGLVVPERFHAAHYRAWPEFQKSGNGAAIGETTELAGLRKNGEEFPIEMSLSAVRVRGQWHAIGIIRDITIRKEAEAKLRSLSVAVEQSPASVVITDTQGTIEYVNPKFTEVTGYTASEAIGQNPRILKSGKWPRKAYKRLWDTILAGQTWTGEFENKRKNGEVYWEAASISPIRDEDGAITRFLAVKQDITERKHAEQAARDQTLAIESANAAFQQATVEAEAARGRTEQAKNELESLHRKLLRSHDRINQLIEAISSILIGVDLDGKVTAWNGAAESTFGVDSEYAVGRSLDDLALEWDLAALTRSMAECRAQNQPVRIDELRFRRPDGTERFLGITLNPMRAGGGREVGILLVAADITEQKILQGQLAQAQKLESIGQLAAGIAHEINTPTQYVGDNIRFLQDSVQDLIQIVDRYAGLLDPDQGPRDWDQRTAEIQAALDELDVDSLKEEIPKAIEQSLEGVERVAKIVRAMKDFSHPGAEGKEAIDLNKAIESTVTVARNEWKYVADMVLQLDPELPPVSCLVGEFNQVVLNIVINAA